MSETPVDISEIIMSAVHQRVTAPMTSQQIDVWRAQVADAYWQLSGYPPFRLVLEDWILGTMFQACETAQEEGRRRFVIDVLSKIRQAVLSKQGQMWRERKE